MGDLPVWAPVVGAIVALANLSWGIWMWHAAARQRSLTELEGKVVQLERELRDHKDDGASSRNDLRERLVHVEERLAHMPTLELQHRLEIGLTQLAGLVNTLSETLQPLARTSARIEDYLMDQGRK